MASAADAAPSSHDPVGVDGGDDADDAGHRQRALKPIGAVALALIGLGAIGAGIGFGPGSLDRPGPGLWPVALGGALVLSTIAFLVFNRDGKEGAFDRDGRHALLVVASIVAFILLFEHVSFLLASVVLLLGCQLAAGARSWWVIALTCVLGTAAAWFLFFQVLGVSAPL